LRGPPFFRILRLIESGFDQLEIPVAEFVPDEMIELMGGFIETELFDPFLHGLQNLPTG